MNPFFNDYNILIAIIGFIVGTIGAIGIANSDRKLGYIVLLAFAIRTVASLPQLSFNIVAGFEKDAFVFEGEMQQWAGGGRPSLLLCFPGQHFYPWLMSFVYEFFGHAPSLIVWINVVFSSLACYVTAKAARIMWGEHAARFTGVTLALFPYWIWDATLILREAPIAICMALGIYLIVKSLKEFTWGRYFGACIFLFLAAAFHDGLIVFLLSWIIYLPFGLRKLGHVRLGTNLGYLGALLALVAVAGVALIGTGKIANAVAAEQAGQQVGALNPANQEDTHASYEYMVPKGNPVAMAAMSPVLALFLLVTPTVWMVRSPFDVVAFADTLFYWWVIYVVVRYWRLIWGNVAARGMLIATMVGVFLLGVGTQNYGTSIRHRAKLLPPLVLLGAATVYAQKDKPAEDEALREEAAIL